MSTKSLQKSEKLNRLLEVVPEGVVVPAMWLQEQGYSRQLVNKYHKNQWLKKLGRGVYCRPGSVLSWESVVLALQHLMRQPVHVGGVTALNQQGFAHYLPLAGEAYIHLWECARIPAWVEAVSLKQQFVCHSRALFNKNSQGAGLNSLPTKVRDWTMIVSGPECAMLEMLSQVTESEASFTFAAEIFEGLLTLRPKLLNSLLQGCKSVKAKRLFLFLGKHYDHQWFDRIELDQIDLGKGKRQVTKEGRYEPEFQITVPRYFGREVK